MLVSDFDYDLPEELIAQEPCPERDGSRMMVVDRKEKAFRHASFRDLPGFLEKGSVLVLNETKVLPARAWGKVGDRDIEFLFLKEAAVPGTWSVLCRPAKHVRPGEEVIFAPGFSGNVIESGSEGIRVLGFPKTDVVERLRAVGFAPLPPYIKRKKMSGGQREVDLARYQTVFAAREGSVAAPTAGLHFTRKILAGIESGGVEIVHIELEVGLATFQPVRTERVEDHRMLEETYVVSESAAETIASARREGRPITAVGTTVVRALESAALEGCGIVQPGKRSSRLFIYPGFQFQVTDQLLTNFHLPRSTLLMLVSAFAGTNLVKKAYGEAVSRRYRFFSYGDCMLIL